MKLELTRGQRWVVLGLVALYLLLGFGRAWSTHPWNDEAWYTSPTWNLMHHGDTGTSHLETTGNFWQGINQRTYWVMPLQFYSQVPWFELFGASLMSARLHAMAWGVFGLLVWGYVAGRITGNAAMMIGAMAVMVCDYQFVAQTSLARMDVMALAFAGLAIALYVTLRQRNVTLAVFASQMSVAMCVLCHPNPAVPAFCAAIFITLYYDRQKLRWYHLFVAGFPFLLAGIAWWLYILPHPDWFRAQFLGNVTDIDRLGGFKHPLTAIGREVGRYIAMAGYEPGMHPLYRIKLVVPLVYAGAFLWLVTRAELRQNRGIRAILGLVLVYAAVMTIYDNTKEVKYAIHLVPIYDVMTAVAVITAWRATQGIWRAVPAGAIAAFAAVGVGGLLYTTFRKNDYHNVYMPVVRFLEQKARPDQLILASSEFGFGLGFDRKMVDDAKFTRLSGKQPDFIVIGPAYRPLFTNPPKTEASARGRAWVNHMLENDFTHVYSAGGYDIYERKPGVVTAPAPQQSQVRPTSGGRLTACAREPGQSAGPCAT